MSASRWSWLGVALVIVAGCGNVKVPEGKLACGKKRECPSGMECRADNLCWNKGADGGAGSAGGGSGAGGATAGAGGSSLDGGVPPDADGAQPDGDVGGCVALANPTGGLVTAAALATGSTATYSCDLGRALSGPAERTCQADGTWSGTAPTCALKDCGALVAPATGSVVAPTTTYGATATYSCGAGFGPSGSSTRRCQLDGKWDGMQPTCVVANCPALPGPTGGSVVAATLTFGATANYACDSGYTLAGAATRTCKPDGTWSDAAPTCTIKDCGALAAPGSGSVSMTGTSYGSTGSFTCETGFSLSGAASVKCQTDGSWSATAPTCVIKDCGALTAPTNGAVAATTTTYGATATYSCMTGYGPSGSATRTCQATGMWDGTAPTCVVANCPALSGPTGGAVSAPTLTTGSTATYSCGAGYDLVGSATRSCQASGAWSGAAPTCAIKTCGVLAAPTNGTVAATVTTYGATATYACSTGYGATGALTRTCQADGTWSGAAPTCTVKSCGTLTGPTNGAVSATVTTYGATATYGCNTGFDVAGAATRTCQADGTWSGTPATCAVKDCGGLPAPTNGSVSAPTTTYGSTATYSCVTGYGPSGSATRTCQATGAWSGTAPTCVIANCPALQSPTGGAVSAPSLAFGSTATYSCNAGYLLGTGSASRTCQANGLWTGSQPTCDPKDCGAPPAPTHGSVAAAMTTFSSVATYSCASGYTLSGSSTRTCQSDGAWSGALPSCVPVDCGAPASISNGNASYTATTFGSTATYACGTSYTLSGAATVSCLATTKWSTPTPSCVDVCTLGGNGTAAHCCASAACSGTKPMCDTTTHICVARALGGACTDGTQCASGYCIAAAAPGTGSVCCESPCNQTCASNKCASGTGKCVASPNRTQCGVIAGDPNWNGYDSQVFLICDGNFNCKAPAIHCGKQSSTCSLSASMACCTLDNVSLTNPGPTCNARSSCYVGSNNGSQSCKDTVDCPTGTFCGHFSNYGFDGATCADLVSYSYVPWACDHTRAGTCPAGQTCVTDPSNNLDNCR
jgi:hypothetical protein